MPQIVSEEAEEQILKIGIKPDVVTAIGYVVVHWSVLEASLYILLGHLLKIPSKPLIIASSETTFLQKAQMISALIHHSGSRDFFDLWRQIETRIDAVRISRNDIIHGIWLMNDANEPTQIRFKARGKLLANRTQKKAKDIKIIVREIIGVTLDVNILINAAVAADLGERVLNPSETNLDHTPSPKALAQDQARADKRSKRHPPHDGKRAPLKLSSAQKRALREMDKNNEKKP